MPNHDGTGPRGFGPNGAPQRGCHRRQGRGFGHGCRRNGGEGAGPCRQALEDRIAALEKRLEQEKS
jgi:hypothetical protein